MRLLRIFFVVFSLLCAPLTVAAEPVNINTADAQTLAAAMKGVGPDKAAAIIAYRRQHGPFKSIDDLKAVKGIGDKTVERNRPNLTAAEPARPEAQE